MRLIDADALIEELHHGIFDDCDCKKDYEYLGIDDYIRNQPTAYDVDKVVEKLKNEVTATKTKCITNVEFDIGIYKAIEVIKAEKKE